MATPSREKPKEEEEEEGWQFCSTEVELFVFIKSSYSVDIALQFGKAWNRSFVGREFL